MICSHENNVPSRLSPQWLCGNSCTTANDARAYDNIYDICNHESNVLVRLSPHWFYGSSCTWTEPVEVLYEML